MSDPLTISQAAAELGVGPSRVQQLCRSGALPARKFGRDWQIQVANLQRYTSGVRTAASEGPKIGRPCELIRRAASKNSSATR